MYPCQLVGGFMSIRTPQQTLRSPHTPQTLLSQKNLQNPIATP